jgi:hypothetical protein
MPHLDRKAPYANTSVEPEVTRAQIDGMLKEFVIVTDGKVTAKVTAVRWTTTEANPLGMLEFGVDFVDKEGMHRQMMFRVTPPTLYKTTGRKWNQRKTPNYAQSMRLTYWWLKSKLEAVLYGLSEISEEFLSEAVYKLKDGRYSTVGETIGRQIKDQQLPQLEYAEQQQKEPLKIIDADHRVN